MKKRRPDYAYETPIKTIATALDLKKVETATDLKKIENALTDLKASPGTTASNRKKLEAAITDLKKVKTEADLKKWTEKLQQELFHETKEVKERKAKMEIEKEQLERQRASAMPDMDVWALTGKIRDLDLQMQMLEVFGKPRGM